MNITEPIWRHCQSQPQKISLVADGKSTTYQELLEQVLLVSARLSEAGVQKGDRVCIGLESPAPLIIVVLALARLGAVASLFKNFWPISRRRMILQRHKVQFLVHQSEAEWTDNAPPGFKNLDVVEIFRPSRADESLQVPEMACDVDDLPWWVGISSATTGRLKSIEKTHRRDAMSVALSSNRRMDKTARLMVYGDVTGLGFSMLRCLTAGGTLILTGSAKPNHFFDVVEQDGPTLVVTTISMVSSLVAFADIQSSEIKKRCTTLQSIELLGGIVLPSLLQRVQHHICDQIEIKYGSTEAGLITSIDQDNAKECPDAHGRLLPWVEAQAVDESGRLLPDGAKGLLRFKTPLLLTGYLDDEQASAIAFRDGWFYSGDIGSVDDAGYLRIDNQSHHLESADVSRIETETLHNGQLTMPQHTVAMPDAKQGQILKRAVITVPAFCTQFSFLETVQVANLENAKAAIPLFMKKLPFFRELKHDMQMSDRGYVSYSDNLSIKAVLQINRSGDKSQNKLIYHVRVHEWVRNMNFDNPSL